MTDGPTRAARVRKRWLASSPPQMADVPDLDLEQTLADMIEIDRGKYPAHLARGRADKYTQLGG